MGLAASFVYQKVAPGNDPLNQKTFNAVLERTNIFGNEGETSLGFIGDWEERPKGIESLKVSVKFLSSIEGDDSSFLMAYEAMISLKSQELKISKEFHPNGEIYFVESYRVDFDFYLLDEDDYCLMEIGTENKTTLHSPGAYPINITPGKDPELIRVVLLGEKIPKDIASRVKKVCYRPVFAVNGWKPEKNKTIKE